MAISALLQLPLYILELTTERNVDDVQHRAYVRNPGQASHCCCYLHCGGLALLL